MLKCLFVRQNLIIGLKEILFPLYCLSCNTLIENNRHFSGICYDCIDDIKYNVPPFCHVCGKHITELTSAICGECKNKKFHFSRCWSACHYDGAIARLIHSFKYQAYTKLSKFFGDILIEFIKDYHLPIEELDIIMPVPLHKRKLREREFNQANLLVKEIAKYFRKESLEENLIKIKDTPSQVEMSKELRLNNVTDAFSVKDASKIENKNVLIIDDVFTTGATLSETAKTLKKSGANLILALTLAH